MDANELLTELAHNMIMLGIPENLAIDAAARAVEYILMQQTKADSYATASFLTH